MKENTLYYLVSWEDDRSTSYEWVSLEDIQKNADKYSHSRCSIYERVNIERFKTTGKRMSANDIMREALGIPFNAPSAHVENNSFERVKIIIGDNKCKIGFDVKKREEWDNAAIIEVFEEFIAMMKAPSEKIKTDDEI